MLNYSCLYIQTILGGYRFACEVFLNAQITTFFKCSTQGVKMNEMHLIIGSVVACIVLVASAVDLYQVTHSE